MANHPNRSQKIRPRQHLREAGKQYPQAWKQIDIMREGKGKDLPDWPNWCFLPMAGFYSIVSASNHQGLIADLAKLSALGAWRVTQGIYRYDTIMLDTIWNTPVNGDIPHDILYHLPEWCVYIETPGKEMMGSELHGFWAHLEHDINQGHTELRLLFDTDGMLIPVPLHIGQHGLKESVDLAVDTSKTHAASVGMTLPNGISKEISSAIEPAVSLVLYLCTKNAEIQGQGKPRNPKPKKTKKGWRLFPASKPKAWDVGVRTGAALRNAYHAQETEQTGTGSAKRPHIRRAHWHTYWKGAGDEKQATLKWIAPISVNIDSNELPATIRKIEE